jgi:hypothetical protein
LIWLTSEPPQTRCGSGPCPVPRSSLLKAARVPALGRAAEIRVIARSSPETRQPHDVAGPHIGPARSNHARGRPTRPMWVVARPTPPLDHVDHLHQ